jgi:hypothetical protein
VGGGGAGGGGGGASGDARDAGNTGGELFDVGVPEVHDEVAPDGPDTTTDAATTTDAGGGDAPAFDAPTDAAPAPLPAWKSGARLRARLLQSTATGDGFFREIVDKDLGATCGFTTAADGKLRCMPPARVPYFGDAGCTQLVLPVDGGCAPPTHVSRQTDCKQSGFKVGPKVTPAKVFLGTPAACNEITMTAGQEYYALTPVADDAFVAGAEVRDARGGGLEMRYWKSDDGGLFPIGAWNTARAASCVSGAGTYAGRCVPGAVAPVSTSVPAWAENTCKQPLGYQTLPTCGGELAKAVTTRVAAGACAMETSYLEATRFDMMPFRSFNTTCFPWTTPPAGYTFFSPGAPIAPASLPALTPKLQGAGRLQVHRFESQAGLAVDSVPGFYDAERKEDCLVELTAAGPRCMPAVAYAASVYSDDKCTKPAHVESKVKPACAVPRPTVLYRETGAPQCGGLPTLEIFEVGAALASPAGIFALDGNGGCKDSGLSPTDNDLYGTTPATTLAPLAFVTE